MIIDDRRSLFPNN